MVFASKFGKALGYNFAYYFKFYRVYRNNKTLQKIIPKFEINKKKDWVPNYFIFSVSVLLFLFNLLWPPQKK